MNAFLRACDYLFVLRPVILIPAWSFYLVGAAYTVGDARFARLPAPAVLAALTAILITAYLLNQIFDRESDERNGKCFFLSRGIFHPRTVVVLAVLFFLAASLLFHRLDATHRWPLVLALVLALIYSLPPLRLCARPFADMAANAVGYGGIAFVLGFRVAGEPWNDAVIQSIPYVLLVAATFLHTTILDVEGDSASGKISTTVRIGDGASRVLAIVLHTLAVAAALASAKMLPIIITGATYPLAVYAAAVRTRRASVLLVQGSTLVVAAAAAIVWPLFALVVAPLVALSRYYHRKRFGITYPGPSKIV